MKPRSVIGVSRRRSAPWRSKSPVVVLKLPPRAPIPGDPAYEDEADEDEIDEEPTARAAPIQEGRRLMEVAREAALTAERTVIADTLRQVHWNRRKAAQLLGVSYKTLLNKIKETGLEQP